MPILNIPTKTKQRIALIVIDITIEAKIIGLLDADIELKYN